MTSHRHGRRAAGAIARLAVTAALLGAPVPTGPAAGCAGARARDAGAAVLARVWDGAGDADVEADVRLGIQAAAEPARPALRALAAQFADAVASRDRARIAAAAVRWPDLAAAARGGIAARAAAGMLSPAAAAAKEERLRLVGELLEAMAREGRP